MGKGKERGMQVAKLPLRGSLVNYTNKNLNADQIKDRDKIFFAIDNDPKIIPSKSKFKQKLAETIGGEYCDPKAAEIEWWTATWRAILSATYHIPLEYRAFAPATLNGKSTKRKGILYNGDVIEASSQVAIHISESLPIPPEHIVQICDNSTTIEFHTNQRGLLTNPSEDTRYVVLRNGKTIFGPATPEYGSHRTRFMGIFGTFYRPIVQKGDIVQIVGGPDLGLNVAIERASIFDITFNTPRPLIIGSDINVMEKAYKKVMADQYAIAQGEPLFYCHPSLRPIHMIFRSRRANPEIIFDNKQMRKLVKNYGWEFIGQILKENKREMIKTQTYIEDSADVVAMRMLESLFSTGKESIRHQVCHKTLTIRFETGLLPASIAYKVAELKREFLAFNVDIQIIEDEGIRVKAIGDMPTVVRRITEVRFNQTKSFDDKIDEDNTVRDCLEAQVAHKEKLVAHFETMQSRDAMRELLEKLPDNAAKYISLVMSPPPELYEMFGSSPRDRDIAVFMGVNSSQIKKFKETIRIQMLALGMGPNDTLESQT